MRHATIHYGHIHFYAPYSRSCRSMEWVGSLLLSSCFGKANEILNGKQGIFNMDAHAYYRTQNTSPFINPIKFTPALSVHLYGHL